MLSFLLFCFYVLKNKFNNVLSGTSLHAAPGAQTTSLPAETTFLF
ncbi:hypothetical protein HMPREF9141_1163 [Prevotella multiformis DSM 16608]|uniref:Uncharacterized protein n=1 Tax=Prevotella multiformis DSM 16608 TaxID=888743 RepID=F0F6E1_9BACT|nr:hypothetical protein HMPREF9141_1163 [Prevotella multiformis DSM 16608]